MGLDCERGHCYAWDTRRSQLPSAAGCVVSTPAVRADCGAASGAAEFGDVAGAAECGLVWIRHWHRAVSGVGCQIQIAGSVHFSLVAPIKIL